MTSRSIARFASPRACVAVVSLALAAPLVAQGDPRPAPPGNAASPQDRDLQTAVELCFSITEEAKAAAKIAEVAATGAADPEKLLRAIKTASPRPAGESFKLDVPFEGIAYPVKVVPPKKAGEAPPPVVLEISSGCASHFQFETPALCGVDNYTPEQFSDASRDSWRKFLHSVSFAVGGDPDRFWLIGFSWGGHAGFDVAAHRPGLVRGFVSLAGGPRRNQFRIFQNLAGAARILAYAGAKDDAEMIWNLKELARLAPAQKLEVKFTLDPEKGHTLPLQGMEEAVPLIDSTAASPPSLPKAGVLLADGDKVALPWLEIVEVNRAAVEIPDAIPVDGSRSKDEQRRETIQKMADHVARIDWKATPAKGGGLALALTGKGVKRAAIFVKAPWFDASQELHVTANGKKVFDGPIKTDPATLLTEARRTGDRQRPTLQRIEVNFGR